MRLNHFKPILKRMIAFERPPLLAALALSCMPALAQAQDDDGSLINAAIAQDAVMGFLPDIPGDLGLSPEDYISGNDHTADTRRVTVRIGPDGHMMPSADWQTYHPAQCRKQARETNEAAQLLTFEIRRITETLDGLTRHQYFASAGVIDAETGIFKMKADGDSTVGQASPGSDGLMENPDTEGVPLAFSDAMRKLGVTIGTPNDGCGDIRLVHQFGSVADDTFGFVAGFQNESSPNVMYEWDFGDGSASGSGEQVGQHIYTEKGTYTVTVHVRGEGIRDGTASVAVVVGEKEEDDPIQPRDGTWTITLTGNDVGGCGSTLAPALRAAMSNMMGTTNTQALSFMSPFHPEPLMKYAEPLTWEQTGANTWRTVLSGQGNQVISISAILTVKVVSPTMIEEVLDLNVDYQNRRCIATSDFDVVLNQ